MYLALKNALGKSFVLFRGLLNEFSGSTAALSLRRLGPYNGPAVRIRRASDNAEVNVRFNGANAVGTDSPIAQSDKLPNEAGIILFDGVDDDINVNTALLPATDDFTLTIKVYVEANPSADATIFSQGTSSGTGRTVIQIKPNGTLFVFAQGPGSLTTGNSFNLGAINTIVFSRSGTTLSLKLNEGTAVTLTSSDPIQQTNSQIAGGYAGDNFEGWFQSLSVGALTWDGTQGAAQGFGWTINGSPQLSVVIPATLGAFLSEPIPTFTADFSSGVNGFVSYSSGTLAGNEDGIGGEDNNLSSTQSGTGQVVYGVNGRTTIGKKYKVSFKYYVPSGSGSYTQISIRDGAHIIIGSDESPTTNNWISVEGTAVFTTPQIRFQFVGTSVTGEKIYIRDVVVSEIGEAKVHTWYDQSGNGNHATQSSINLQPKIAEAGTIKTQGGKPCLDFDGVDDVMEFPQADVQSGNIRSVFVACSAPTSQNTSVMGTEGEFLIKRDSSRAISLNNFSASRLDSAFSFSGTGNHLVTVIRNFTAPSSSLSLDGDVDATRTDSYGLSLVHQIGGKKSGSNIIEEADFNCLEIIVYASDQTTNRTAIESNIDDYYDII